MPLSPRLQCAQSLWIWISEASRGDFKRSGAVAPEICRGGVSLVLEIACPLFQDLMPQLAEADVQEVVAGKEGDDRHGCHGYEHADL